MSVTSREDFEYWLADMPDALERFFKGLSPDIRERLDFSLGTLETIEAWILTKYADTKQALLPEESRAVDGLARYIGESLRRNIGGKWSIRLDDPSYVYHGIPELTGFAERSTPVCPHTLVTATADRRTGKYLTGIAGNLVKRYGQKKSGA